MKRGLIKEAGKQLRLKRERLGYTMHDVEARSRKLAKRLKSKRYLIPPSRLSDIELGRSAPSIFRCCALAKAYSWNIRDILALYGI